MRARWWVALVLGVAVVAGVALIALRPSKPSDGFVHLQVGGRDRVYLPAQPRTRNPKAHLVVFLPGLLTGAKGSETATDLDLGAAQNGAVIVYAQGYQLSFDVGGCCGKALTEHVDDVAYLQAVIADARSRYKIGPATVDLVGFSNGALMAYRFACEHPELVDAFVSASGSLTPTGCVSSPPVSLLAMHGRKDLVVPIGGGTSPPLKGLRLPPVSTSVLAVGRRDGCSDKPDLGRSGNLVLIADLSGCPQGTAVRLIVSAALSHQWATGQVDQAELGLDESALTWAFFAQRWT